MTKQQIYDELSRVLTDYEGNGEDNKDKGNPEPLYKMLVDIQNSWDNITVTE